MLNGELAVLPKVAEYLNVLICGTVSKVDFRMGKEFFIYQRELYAGVK